MMHLRTPDEGVPGEAGHRCVAPDLAGSGHSGKKDRGPELARIIAEHTERAS